MKTLIYSLCLLLWICSVDGRYLFAQSRSSDTNENRLKAAKRYLRIMPMKSLVEDMAEEMAKRTTPEKGAKIKKVLNEKMDVSALERAATDAMLKNFSVDEINALADFYGSKDGRSIMKKFSKYMADLMPAIQREAQRRLETSD